MKTIVSFSSFSVVFGTGLWVLVALSTSVAFAGQTESVLALVEPSVFGRVCVPSWAMGDGGFISPYVFGMGNCLQVTGIDTRFVPTGVIRFQSFGHRTLVQFKRESMGLSGFAVNEKIPVATLSESTSPQPTSVLTGKLLDVRPEQFIDALAVPLAVVSVVAGSTTEFGADSGGYELLPTHPALNTECSAHRTSLDYGRVSVESSSVLGRVNKSSITDGKNEVI